MSSPSNEAPSIEQPIESVPEPSKRRRYWLLLLDIAIFLALTFAALPIRFSATQGDLWGDEADYAIASQMPLSYNQTDRSPDPNQPNKLVAMRHYHPPLTVYLSGLGIRNDRSERSLRTPFVIAGAITVGLIYLCGIPLFKGRREIAIGCALILLDTPLHIRASSHAIPWSFITFFIVTLLWTQLQFLSTRKPGWLFGSVVILGAFYLLSEMVFPTLILMALMLPILFYKQKWSKLEKRNIAIALVSGAVVAVIAAQLLWPVGFKGGALKMISHYANMRGIVYPVNLGNRIYQIAPKWAYLYWFSRDFRPYFCLYAAGALTLIFFAIRRQITREILAVTLFALFYLAVSHAAHIIGPEYLVHCLPLLALIAGLFFYALSFIKRPIGAILLLPICIYLFRWDTTETRLNLDAGAAVSRWPEALKVIAPTWKDGDKILVGPQTPGVAMWYIKYAGRLPFNDGRIGQVTSSSLKPASKEKINSGAYRYIIIASTFTSTPTVSYDILNIVKKWNVVYQSVEPASIGAARMTIYEFPGKEPPPVVGSPDLESPPATQEMDVENPDAR